MENGPPVAIVCGLCVEDADHHQVFMMSRAKIELVVDYEDAMLNATYLAAGINQNYEDGGM